MTTSYEYPYPVLVTFNIAQVGHKYLMFVEYLEHTYSLMCADRAVIIRNMQIFMCEASAHSFNLTKNSFPAVFRYCRLIQPKNLRSNIRYDSPVITNTIRMQAAVGVNIPESKWVILINDQMIRTNYLRMYKSINWKVDNLADIYLIQLNI